MKWAISIDSRVCGFPNAHARRKDRCSTDSVGRQRFPSKKHVFLINFDCGFFRYQNVQLGDWRLMTSKYGVRELKRRNIGYEISLSTDKTSYNRLFSFRVYLFITTLLYILESSLLPQTSWGHFIIWFVLEIPLVFTKSLIPLLSLLDLVSLRPKTHR